MLGGNFKAPTKARSRTPSAFAMHKVADKVTEAIKKAGPVSK